MCVCEAESELSEKLSVCVFCTRSVGAIKKNNNNVELSVQVGFGPLCFSLHMLNSGS